MSALKDAVIDAWVQHLTDPDPAATRRAWNATEQILREAYRLDLSRGEVVAMCREMVITWAVRACFSPFVEGADTSYCPDVAEVNRIIVPAAQRLGLFDGAALHAMLGGYGLLHRRLDPDRYQTHADGEEPRP